MEATPFSLRPVVVLVLPQRHNKGLTLWEVLSDWSVRRWPNTHGSLAEWAEQEWRTVARKRRLRVYWKECPADAAAVAAELYRLGVPHIRRFARW
jgi:hypothetical protein